MALLPAITPWGATSVSAPQDSPSTSSPVPATTSTSARPPRTHAIMAALTRKGATSAAARPGTTEWDRGKAATPLPHTQGSRKVDGDEKPRRTSTAQRT